jgi:hypothetical protein
MTKEKLKIGVLFTAYNCADYLNECLKPWFDLKKHLNLKFAINTGMFKIYKDLNFPNRNKETLDIIYNYRFDYLLNSHDSVNLDEDTSRNLCLNYLKDIQGCDLIWLVDGDEVYNYLEIENTIDFILKNITYDWYSICMRNFTFEKKYHLDFDRPNIFWVARNQGMNKFVFDAHLQYNDGTLFYDHINICIPKNILFVDHYSWLQSDTRSKEKIEYQKIRHHGEIDTRSSYIMNDNDELFFNKNFYEKRNLLCPLLHEYLHVFDNRISISYDKNQKKLFIISTELINNTTIQIFDSANSLIMNWNVDLSNQYFLWHLVDLDGCHKLNIFVDNKLIHCQNLYVNFKML